MISDNQVYMRALNEIAILSMKRKIFKMRNVSAGFKDKIRFAIKASQTVLLHSVFTSSVELTVMKVTELGRHVWVRKI